MTYDDWTSKDEAAADAEGWGLFDCHGSMYGKWQIQKIDEDDVLEDDDAAWRIVLTGDRPHHAKARQFIQEHNPSEWLDFIASNPDLAPRYVAQTVALQLMGHKRHP